MYVCTFKTDQVTDLVLKGKKNTVVLHPREQMHSLETLVMCIDWGTRCWRAALQKGT